MNEKVIPRRQYSISFIAAGAAILIFGIILKIIDINGGGALRTVIFDLPWLLIGIGLILTIYGIMQFTRAEQLGEVIFSSKTVKLFLANNAIILALLVLIVVICCIETRFMQIRVVLDILTQSSTKLIIALGICFTLLIAGTDLSAGRMVGLAAVVSTSMLQTAEYANRFYPDMPQISIVFPIIAAVLACMVFGTLNGFLVAKFTMHPFIATLAVQVMIYGTTSLYFDMAPNKSQPIGGVRPDFAIIGQKKLLEGAFMIDGKPFPGISVLVPIAICIGLIIWFVLNKTVFGKNVYAIGGNREAAVVSGVNVFRTTMFIFILASSLYGVAGVLEAARTAGATNNYGAGYELDAIAACVVSGVSLNGGVGKVGGIISGVLIFSVIQYGLQFISVSPMWQQVIKGVIIAVAVAIDMGKYRKK